MPDAVINNQDECRPMKRVYFFPVLIFLVSAVCGNPKAEEKINVFVSIPPQKFLVERIGGDRVIVTTMLKPGHSPETYDPVPGQMAMLSRARIYFLMGVPFETRWRKKISRQNDRMIMINTCQVCYTRDGDPHTWTSPVNAIQIASQIKSTLLDVDPGAARVYETNYQGLVNELKELDAEIIDSLKDRRTDYFIVSHDAWAYYADRYGLKQITLESGGREKGPRGIAVLVDKARYENIHILFIQEQHPTGPAYTLARELDARAVVIDPLAENYIENLRHVTELIVEAVK